MIKIYFLKQRENFSFLLSEGLAEDPAYNNVESLKDNQLVIISEEENKANDVQKSDENKAEENKTTEDNNQNVADNSETTNNNYSTVLFGLALNSFIALSRSKCL